MTRRDLQNDMREKKRPWDIGKSFAQAAPIAPIHPVAHDRASRARRDLARRQRRAPAAGRPRRHDLGRRRTRCTFLSQYYELLPGDLVFTGTPAGVGAGGRRAIASTARIDGLVARCVVVDRAAP